MAANQAFDEKDYQVAVKLYKKSIELAPYLHQGHFGIAKSEYQRGNLRASRLALQEALEQAFDSSSKSIYEAKLAVMTKERFNQLKLDQPELAMKCYRALCQILVNRLRDANTLISELEE